MTFNEVKGNFYKVEFHKPTKNITGTGIQMKACDNGEITIQMAKQLTANNKQSQATYAWNDPNKNTFFMLNPDEIRKIIFLLRKGLNRKARLFDAKTMDKNNIDDYDNVKLFHNSGTSVGKQILFLLKEYNGNLQAELSVFFKRNGTNLSFAFSFSEDEMRKLEMILYFHQAKEFKVDQEGYMSCLLLGKEVLKVTRMPTLNVDDFIVMTVEGKKTTFKIKSKTFVVNKNVIVYSLAEKVSA